MRILLVAVLVAACSDGGVRHTPDATSVGAPDAPADAALDAPLAPAALSGSPGATSFGDVVLGQTTAKVTYTITNDGEQASGTVTLVLDSTTAGFAVSGDTCSDTTLAPHATCTFAVAFSPVGTGAAMTTVRASASPGGEVARDLMANGLTPGAINIVETGHDFTRLAVDATPLTHSFTVTNSGQVATGVPMPAITGTTTAYAIASTTCSAALAPAGTCSVVVRFDPNTVGDKPASLVVTGSPGGSDAAMLSGTGFAHVAVTRAGSGAGTVTSNMTGVACGSACAADFSSSPVSLIAAPATGSTFTGWTGDCTGTSTCSLDLTAGKAVTATFALQTFPLTITTSGNGSGTVAANPPGGTYTYGTMVTLTASPATGSTFTGWGGACSGTGTCSVTMTQARSVTATFTAIPEKLDVTNGGGGTVTSQPSGISCGAGCSFDYPYGTMVTLTATPDAGHTFGGWGGACSGTQTTCTVAMTQAQSVIARWLTNTYTFTLAFTGDGAGTVTINGQQFTAGTSFAVSYGQQLVLSASPGSGYVFAGWAGACSGTGGCNLTIAGDTSVTAELDQSTYRFTVTATTANANYFAFGVTYPPSTTSTADCTSTTTGTTCAGSAPRGSVITLVAHLPSTFPAVWNDLPSWQGCDAISTDGLKCTFTLLALHHSAVSGDAAQGP